MLSGIGHAQHLRDHGIDVRRGPAGRRQPARPPVPRADLPHDHVEDARQRRSSSPGAWPRRSLRPGTTFLANSVFEAVAFLRTSQATDVPDLQLHLLPWSYVSPNQDEPIRHDVDPRTVADGAVAR